MNLIFSAPRFVVLDDKENHLTAITKAFQQLGTPCMGIHYDPTEELKREYFRGVRCLFVDLHLIDGQAGTDQKRHYAVISSILEENINPDGGPYILVLWTEHSHYCSELKEYLHGIPTQSQPLAVLSLSKEQFINTGDGSVKNSDGLLIAVRKSVLSNPQLAALLKWESSVFSAAGETLASILNLVSDKQRIDSSFSEVLDTLLSRLSQEAVGRPNVSTDPRAAINNALAPILIDRIMNQSDATTTSELWEKAITQYKHGNLGNATPEEASRINRMLHIANSGSEMIRAIDWGAVINCPFGDSDDSMKEETGLTIKDMLCQEFKLRSSAISECKISLVRIGAACDYAQNKKGPIPFLLAVEIPEKVERQMNGDKPVKLSDAIWQSPVFVLPNDSDPVRLYVHFRFPFSKTEKYFKDIEARYRLREQLLMNLIAAASNYTSRPSVIQFPVS
jgi:hypothetical protein